MGESIPSTVIPPTRAKITDRSHDLTFRYIPGGTKFSRSVILPIGIVGDALTMRF